MREKAAKSPPSGAPGDRTYKMNIQERIDEMKRVDSASSLTDVGPGCRYGDAKYWDKRYDDDKNVAFDWLRAWKDIKETIERKMVQSSSEGDVPVSDQESLKVK